MNMDADLGHRLRVKWNRAHDMFASFFRELSDVRRTIGDDQLPSWSVTHLKLGISVIKKVSAILTETDAAIEKENLRQAIRAERDARKAKRQEQAELKVERAIAKAAKKAEKERKAAEAPAKKPPRVKKSVYDRAVAACLVHVKHQWAIGDWAIKVTVEKKYGDGTLAQFASDIGMEFDTVRRYRDVAKAWPENARRPAHSVGMALAAHPDRVAILASNPSMKVDEAREIMRKYRASSNVIPMNG